MGKRITRKERGYYKGLVKASKIKCTTAPKKSKTSDIVPNLVLHIDEDNQNEEINSKYDSDDQRIVKILMAKCKMTKDAIEEAHDNFLLHNPNGELSKDDFLKEFEDPLIANAVFKVFDVDRSGTMDFVEYMQARNAVNLNSAEDKLDWIFCLFDSDGGGSVDLNEIEDIVRSIFDFSGMKQDEKIIEACVGDVRRSLDRNRDGSISKEEFINNARRSRFIRNMFDISN